MIDRIAKGFLISTGFLFWFGLSFVLVASLLGMR